MKPPPINAFYRASGPLTLDDHMVFARMRGIMIVTLRSVVGKLMPIHDWSRKPVGLFHHFHQRWVVSICDALNAGRLPDGFYALLEQHAAGVIPDVVTLERGPRSMRGADARGEIAVAAAPPKTRFMSRATDEDMYAAKADRVAVYNPRGEVGRAQESVCRAGRRGGRVAGHAGFSRF
jgi:hypothetical protein